MDVTAVLLNYARPALMSGLIGALRGQSVPVRILLGDNAAVPHHDRGLADAYVAAPWNAGTFLRISLSFWADTEWVMFLDDDKLPRGRDFVRQALAVAREHRGGITGAMGRSLAPEPPHYREDAYGPCQIVKGFMMLFERSLLSRVAVAPPFPLDAEHANRADDIHLSLSSGRGRARHWADRRLLGELEERDGFTEVKDSVGLRITLLDQDLRPEDGPVPIGPVLRLRGAILDLDAVNWARVVHCRPPVLS